MKTLPNLTSRTAVAWALKVAFAAVWLAACWQETRPALILAAALGLGATVWPPLRQALGRTPLALAGVALAALVLKDLWPSPGPWLQQPEGDLGRFAALPVRNPQVADAVQQVGAIAAAVLGASVLIAARGSGRLDRRPWLASVALALLTFVTATCWVLVPAHVFDAAHHLAGVKSKNSAATLAALGLILAVGLARLQWREGRPGRSLTWAAGAALAAVALALLHSATGIVGAAAGLALLALPAGRRSRSRALHFCWSLLVPLGFTLVMIVYKPDLGGRLAGFAQEYRLRIWRDSLPLLAEYPVGGVGLAAYPGTIPLVSRLDLPADSRLAHPDSSWVLLAVEWGPVATLVLVLSLLGTLRRGPEKHRAYDGESEALALQTNQAAVLSWLVCGLFDPSLHRSETLVPGIALLGTLNWNLLPFWMTARGAATAAVGLALVAGGAVAALTLRGTAGPGDLRWDPLNPQLHYRAALEAWNRQGDRPEAVRHFRLSVRLDSHSAQLPAAIGRILAGPAPSEAAWFWAEVLRRTRGDPAYGSLLLLEGVRSAPQLPPEYWEPIAAAEHPDALLALGAQPGFPASRLLQTWIERGAPGSLSDPNLAAFFFAALDRAPDAGTLLALLLPQRESELPAAVSLAAARRLHAAGGSDLAWTTLIRLEPVRSLDEMREALRADPRYRQWVQLLDEQESHRLHDSAARMRLLNEIIRHAGAAPWFRWEQAKLLHLLGQDREAVDGLLGLFPDKS